MSKYALFADFLGQQKTDVVALSFSEVEKVLGFKLPDSAYGQRAWWSNNVNNNVMTRVWKKAGFRTRHVDMKTRKVVFQRQKTLPSAPAWQMEQNRESMVRLLESVAKNKQANVAVKHPLRGALKGVLRIVAGTDITKPADPNWGDQ